MKSFKILTFSRFSRVYCTSTKLKIMPNVNNLNSIEQDLYKPRRHPGILNIKTITVPTTIVSAIENVLADHPIKKILKDAEVVNNQLKYRVSPMEPEQIQNLKDQIHEEVFAKEQDKLNESFVETEEIAKLRQSIKDKVIARLKVKVYNWQPISYDAYSSLVYLMARFPMEYAVLFKIFGEIHQRDKQFNPRSLFDFGSGTGSAMWACNQYYGRLYEYFNVDVSSFMNDLSLLLLQGGRGNKQVVKGVFFRQFMPANNTLYDVVVSSYSLLELPSFEARMETILKLWNKTARYLIIVEQGSNAGFKVINAARDYLLQVSKEHNEGFVFSPCPHDLSCPRFIQDDTPCNFPVSYHTLPIGAKPEVKKDVYSYVVLRKGNRSDDNNSEWPRVVRETLVRSKHTICRMCTKYGTLDEAIFTASKHGKSTYHCARATKWGDRLPIDVEKSQEDRLIDSQRNNKLEPLKPLSQSSLMFK